MDAELTHGPQHFNLSEYINKLEYRMNNQSKKKWLNFD